MAFAAAVTLSFILVKHVGEIVNEEIPMMMFVGVCGLVCWIIFGIARQIFHLADGDRKEIVQTIVEEKLVERVKTEMSSFGKSCEVRASETPANILDAMFDEMAQEGNV